MTNQLYTTNIPFATNNPSDDQPKMQQNTNSINALIALDHFSFNDNNGGRHKQVQMPLCNGGSGSIPPNLSVGEGTLYTKLAISTNPLTESNLFYTPDNSTNQYQLTRPSTLLYASCGTNNPYGTPPATFTQNGGWTFLPGGSLGGLLFQFGFYGKLAGTGSSGLIQFPAPFTFVPFSIQLTLGRDSGNQSVTIDSQHLPTTTGFNFLSSSNSSDFIYWTAIGI